MINENVKTCIICNSPLKREGYFHNYKYKIKNHGHICKDCNSKIRISKSKLSNMEYSEVKKYFDFLDENINKLKNFKETHRVNIGSSYLSIDEENKYWYYLRGNALFKTSDPIEINPPVYKFKDLINYEVIKDGKSIDSGGLGRAAIGGFLGGGIGALIGSNTRKYESYITSLVVRVAVDNPFKNNFVIPIVNGKVKVDSFSYRVDINILTEVLSTLDLILNYKKRMENYKERELKYSIADEIIKLKKLLDEGILTKEEYEKAKNKLLT